MKKESLEIKCEGSFMVDWRQLINMQGNLKSLSDENLEKGKRSFIENGFIDSFKVWFKTDSKKQPVNTMKILDGHQRAEKIIPALIESGMSIPKMLPADKVFASTKKEAIKCLLTFVSQLGRVEPEALHDFILEHDLDFEFIQSMDDYPGINSDVFELRFQGDIVDNPLDEWNGMPEFEQEEIEGSVANIVVHFADEKDITAFEATIKQSVTKKTKYIWFPKKQRADLKSMSIVDES